MGMLGIERDVDINLIINMENERVLQNAVEDVRGLVDGSRRARNAMNAMAREIDAAGSSYVHFSDKMKMISIRMKEVGDAMMGAGRKVGFSGFILEFTLSRLLKSLAGFGKALMGITMGASGADNALGWLDRTISAMAIAGDLTAEKMEEVMEAFWGTWEAGTGLASAVADLELVLKPFQTTLASVAEDGLTQITNAIRLIIEDNPDLIESFKTAADALKDRLVASIIGFVENLPGWLEGMDALMLWIGDFTGGLIDGAIEVIDFGKDLATMGENIADFLGIEGFNFWRWAGEMTVKLIVLGKILGVVGSLLTLVGGTSMVSGGVMGTLATLFGAGGAAAANAAANTAAATVPLVAPWEVAAGGAGLGVGAIAGAAGLGGLIGLVMAKGLELFSKATVPWAWNEGDEDPRMGGPGGTNRGLYLQDILNQEKREAYQQQVVVYGGDVTVETLHLDNMDELNLLLESIEKANATGAYDYGYQGPRN